MHRTTRRAWTIAGGAIASFALFTGSAAAHYCYTFKAPDGKRTGSTAWATAEETAAFFATAPFLEDDCRTVLVAHITELGEAGAVFMGPGLLAAGAVRGGRAPDGFGHLFEDARAFPECAELFAEPH